MTRVNQKGFSLVELVIALGLLAGVLISIAGLFVVGGQQVKAGRTSSQAVAMGKQILEEMNGWAFRQTYSLFGLDGSANTYTIDCRSNTSTYCAGWQNTLRTGLGTTAYVTIGLNSLAKTGTPAVMNNDNCRNIRVVVTVNWREGARPRTATVATVRN